MDASLPFDDDLVARVAADHGVETARLRSLLCAHQRLVRETPGTGGVAGLVYEWRRAFGRDPVVARRSAAFYLAVEPHVWDEYVSALAADDGEAAALRAVHAAAGEPTDDDRDPMVVARG